jgi:integrase
VVLGLGTGIRPIEGSRIRTEDFDWEHQIVTVRAKKRMRHVPMPKGVIDILKPLLAGRTGALWRYHSDTAHDILSKLRRIEPKLPDAVTFQRLRATAAFRLSRESI